MARSGPGGPRSGGEQPPSRRPPRGFRNPLTGSDYRAGDDYTMPISRPAPGPPDPGYSRPAPVPPDPGYPQPQPRPRPQPQPGPGQRWYPPDGQDTQAVPPPDPYGRYAEAPYADAPYADAPYADAPYADVRYSDGRYADGAGYPDIVYDEDLYRADVAGGPDGPPPGGNGGKPGRGGRGPRGAGDGSRRPRKRRVRRFFRRPTVRVISGLLLIGFCWVCFSVGQAISAPNGGSMSSKLAEWARDHYLGPVVTFGEWLTYQPPKVGGKPQFSLADPQPTKVKFKHVKGFRPDIPKALVTFARPALPGEGEWRLQETIKGQPAVYTTFLRVDAVHTSYVAGIASFDQRLVSFQLRPGTEDPGTGFGHAQSWIPAGHRTGLVATFNGGFRLNASEGGFYLNGSTYGTLTKGAASVVYYRNGTIKVGEWGRDMRMTSQVAGVRQNLKLIVDHGNVPASVDQDVESSWGATLGGAYDVWRSGVGVTADGRVIYVYGPALSVHQLASLLQRAGAVEAMQLDINPFWTSFEYYQAKGHPSDPAPVMLLPTQQTTPLRYYSPYNRDFTAVFAR